MSVWGLPSAVVFASALTEESCAAEGRFASLLVCGVSVLCDRAEVKLFVVVAEGLRDEAPGATLGCSG
jgi:hypothetical protein